MWCNFPKNKPHKFFNEIKSLCGVEQPPSLAGRDRRPRSIGTNSERGGRLVRQPALGSGGPWQIKFLSLPLTPYTQFNAMTKNFTFRTAGGRILCTQCQAKAKSTQQQCRRPAVRGKKVCRLHGGVSTGPRTAEGRQRCAEARLIHGQETTALRNERRFAGARLAILEMTGHALGFMHGGRTRGRKPALMGEVEQELWDVVRNGLYRRGATT